MDILITEELVAQGIQSLTAKYSLLHDASLWNDAPRLRDAIHDARTIMVRNQTQITAELLAAATNLIGIGRLGVGLDNIDVAAASSKGVVVIAPLEANAISVAELTVGLVLALARRICYADHSTRAGGWDRKGCVGVELAGKSLAICGFGRIGRLVAARARAFDLRVLVFDPFVKPDSPILRELNATLCERLEDALGAADFVSTHSPLTPETKHLFNARTFAAMKRGALFINTSRGGVVDEAALLEALRNGHLAGAALDVREVEPPPARSSGSPRARMDSNADRQLSQRAVTLARLESMENVLLTPHIGAATVEAQTRTFEVVAADIDRLLRGEPAMSFVNFARPRR